MGPDEPMQRGGILRILQAVPLATIAKNGPRKTQATGDGLSFLPDDFWFGSGARLPRKTQATGHGLSFLPDSLADDEREIFLFF